MKKVYISKQVIGWEDFTYEVPDDFEDYNSYCEIDSDNEISVEFHEDGYQTDEALREADFRYGLPLILGSAWEKDTADEIGALLIETGTPITSEVILNRTYIGYNGAISLLENIYSATVKK